MSRDHLVRLLSGSLRPVAEIAKSKTGQRPSPQTAARWVKSGISGVRLPAVLVGRKWCTTSEAMTWWLIERSEVYRAESDAAADTGRH